MDSQADPLSLDFLNDSQPDPVDQHDFLDLMQDSQPDPVALHDSLDLMLDSQPDPVDNIQPDASREIDLVDLASEYDKEELLLDEKKPDVPAFKYMLPEVVKRVANGLPVERQDALKDFAHTMDNSHLPMRVATLCSGTDLALDTIQDLLCSFYDANCKLLLQMVMTGDFDCCSLF